MQFDLVSARTGSQKNWARNKNPKKCRNEASIENVAVIGVVMGNNDFSRERVSKICALEVSSLTYLLVFRFQRPSQ